jgi:hypothetical protein
VRWPLAVLFVTLAAACRRGSPPAPAEPTPVAASPETAPPRAAPEQQAAPAITEAQPAAVPAPPPGDTPAPAEHPEAPSAPAEEDPEDEAIFTWTDEEGVVHFGGAEEIPNAHRPSARSLRGGVTVVETERPELPEIPAPRAPAAPIVIAPPVAGEPAPANDEPGDAPKLDEQGLPIPGTMKETHHTRAVRQATGVQLDPAAVERQYQQQLRDMKCVEKDGVVTCG